MSTPLPVALTSAVSVNLEITHRSAAAPLRFRVGEVTLWQHATTQLEELEQRGEEALVLWDESVLEKPESSANPDLGSVRSSKAHRLTRIKPGFYRPPSAPI